ncbi:signal peptide peptidase SppA [Natronomonas pharaonis DSM 2160]|uniref:Signal peptide peptidase SppA n=2 Tax=Natronomonas pharaonis TaxID=2257 RepID=A0A1U7ETL7_NATPD|nr:signal peptide peptidase SppA [Natronomonas pharaonis DSM 2160]
MSRIATASRVVLGVFVAAVVAVAGWVIFIEVPTTMADLVGVVFVIVAATVGLRIGGNIATSLAPGYNVAEVAVEGPITRDGGGGMPLSPPGSPGADDIVEQIEDADADDNVEALLLRLNTPGGAVVPSDDIRLAAEAFDGPTVAYTTDACASGGYWIASGCDELWARRGSVVGSIGVRGSRMTAAELLDRAGVEYEQLTAGEYKEAGVPFDDLGDDERQYLQGIVDDYYDQFVETVAEGREMEPSAVRETEAKVFLGEEAFERGLVDDLGTKDEVCERLEEVLGTEVETTELEPQQGLAARLQGGAERVAYAFGAGLAGRFVDAEGEFRFRV